MRKTDREITYLPEIVTILNNATVHHVSLREQDMRVFR